MKRFLSAVSMFAMLSPASAFAIGIQVMISGQAVVFTDIPQSAWYATYVRSAAEAGIVNGYRDARGKLTGKFGPSNYITVAEALKIAVEGAGYDDELYGSLVSGGVDHWASAYVAVAKSERFAIVENVLRLDRPATRSQVASMFADAFRVNAEFTVDDSRYVDVDTSTEFSAPIEALSRDGVLTGDTDIHGQPVGTFRPRDPINRAEVAKMVIEARAVYGTPGEGREPSQAENTVMFYSDNGFEPDVIRITKGDTVEFRNMSTVGLWVASDPHPMHTSLPSLNTLEAMLQGESYFYTFTKAGTWTFHNHVHSSHRGTVVVE